MGIINREKFTDLLIASPVLELDRWYPRGNLRSEIQNAIGGNAQVQRILAGQINRAAALEVYDQIKQYIGEYGFLRGKYLRPWSVDPSVLGGLDRNEPWWGFEFETGWVNRDARRRAVHHTWDTWDNVTFDSEGEGAAPVEITFAPQEVSKYRDGTADALQFVQFLHGNADVQNGGYENVGTHINVSHPALKPNNVGFVAASLNRTLAALPTRVGGVDVRKKMYGRSQLYGGCFRGESGDYIEGKLFRTTYDTAQFQTYLRTCEAMTFAVEVLCAVVGKARDDGRSVPYITNLYEMFLDGAEPVIAYSWDYGPLDGVRGGGAINGPYARDRYDEETAGNPMAQRYQYNNFDFIR